MSEQLVSTLTDHESADVLDQVVHWERHLWRRVDSSTTRNQERCVSKAATPTRAGLQAKTAAGALLRGRLGISCVVLGR